MQRSEIARESPFSPLLNTVEAISVRSTRHYSASIRAAFAAAALIFAATGTAGAQTIAPTDPATTASAAVDQTAPATTPAQTSPAAPVAQPLPAPVPAVNPVIGQAAPPRPAPRPAPKATPFSYMPVIDVVVTFTQPAYYGNRNAIPATGLSPVNLYDPLDVGGTVRFPITRKFNLLFDRITEGTRTQPLECVLQAAAPGGPAGRVCPSATRDILLQYHATYAFDRYVTLDVGDSFRHRIWNNGASGVSRTPYLCNNNGQSTGPNCSVSSTEHHFGYGTL